MGFILTVLALITVVVVLEDMKKSRIAREKREATTAYLRSVKINNPDHAIELEMEQENA